MNSRPWFTLAALLALGCLPPSESPPPLPPVQQKPVAGEAAPLPLEEMPSPEPAAPADPPNATPVEPGITPTSAPTRGTLPKAVLDEKLKAASPSIQACYERALQKNPELRGGLTVHFVIGTDGKVVHADASDGEPVLSDAPTIDCIVSEVRKLEFPPPRGGRVFVDYPLRLEPSGAASP